MRIILTASKDATIYEAFENINAGLDEILEVGKVIDATSSSTNDATIPGLTIAPNSASFDDVNSNAEFTETASLSKYSVATSSLTNLVTVAVQSSIPSGSGIDFAALVLPEFTKIEGANVVFIVNSPVASENQINSVTYRQAANLYATGSVRSLIYFELPTTASVPATASYFLNLKLANADNVKRNQQILIYQVSRSWDEGSGFFYQDVENVEDGASWARCTSAVSWSNAGGDLLTGSTSQSVVLSSYPLQDIRVDVTSILQPFVSQSIQNTFHGLALQFPTADETDFNNKGNIKFFSTQTHTIHQPTLEIAFDAQTVVTGSLLAISSLDVKIAASNLRETYTKGDVDKITFVVRDQYPLKSFDSVLRYKNKYYLPTSSYFSVVDVQSDTTIIPFDDFSKINTDVTGSYIILDTSPLYRGRFYTLKLKVVNGDYSRVISTDTLFKVQ